MIKTASSADIARAILGNDFITPEKIQFHREGVFYTSAQLTKFNATVPSLEILEWCSDNGYMLVAGPQRPMSLLEIRSLNRHYFFARDRGWYAEQAFAQNDKIDTRWIMLRKEPVPQSTAKNWNEQLALLSEDEITPNAAEVAWCVTVYKVVHNTFLFPNFVRTSSFDSVGNHVGVGDSGAGILRVCSWSNDCRKTDVGVSAARKH